MAFGITRDELEAWKMRAKDGHVALITHYWYDPRFPQHKTVTKAGCTDKSRLIEWGRSYGLEAAWIDERSDFPHFDLLGSRQLYILREEGYFEQIERFDLQ